VRSDTGGNERAITAAQYGKVASVHGMAGVGAAGQTHVRWVQLYQQIAAAMVGQTNAIGFGTDSSGMSPLMSPPPPDANQVQYSAAFPMSTLGDASWNFDDAGVAHYGLLADFVQAVGGADGGAAILPSFMQGAQYFFDTWLKAEAYSAKHAGDGGVAPAVAAACPAGTTRQAACNACLGPRVSCPALPRPPCGMSRPADRWGVCVSSAAHAMSTASVRLAAAKTTSATGPSLAPGAYTLVLLGPESASSQPRKHSGFDVVVASSGSNVTIQGSTAAAGPAVTGAFRPLLARPGATPAVRGSRFTARVNAGASVLVLTGAAPATGTLTEIRGGYASQQAGQAPVTGLFILKRTSTFSSPPAPATVQPYGGLGAFLTSLRP
jgi:hypothetical protein